MARTHLKSRVVKDSEIQKGRKAIKSREIYALGQERRIGLNGSQLSWGISLGRLYALREW
jgi:hypothetical protein